MEDNRPGTDGESVAAPIHTGRYFSRALGREQPYAYLAPRDWEPGRAERRYPLLVMLHGYGDNYRAWLDNTRIARYAADLNLFLAFPDGGKGWHTNAAHGGERYEDDLIQEFLPHLQQTLPLREPGRAWAIAGLSMGGYGAVKIALKYPHLFSVASSHSGAFEIARMPEFHPVFGDPGADAALRLAENPFRLAEQAMSRFPMERPRLYLFCGLQDELLESNRRFDGHLTFIGYPHRYEEAPGHHAWPYWNRTIRQILPRIAEDIGA